MYRAMVWSSNMPSKARVGNQDLIREWATDESLYIWLDLHGNKKSDEKTLLETDFQLHPLAISDAQRERHPAKFEHFDTNDFVLLKELLSSQELVDFKTNQLAIFSGDRFIITRSVTQSTSLNTLWSKTISNIEKNQISPSLLLARLAQSVADTYIKLLLDVEDRLENLEDEMFKNPSDKLLEEIVLKQTHLRKITRILSYHTDLFTDFKQLPDSKHLNQHHHDWVNVFDHTERAFSLATLYYGLTEDLVEGYISVASHRLNQIMKVLTIFTVIFVPLSFIAGVYGMNFENMPELKSKSGYFILLAVMFSLASGLLIIFKKRKWL